MFTGIIEQIGTVTALDETSRGLRLSVQASFHALTIGESIAVNGVCLTLHSCEAWIPRTSRGASHSSDEMAHFWDCGKNTVEKAEHDSILQFDVSEETRRCTHLGQLTPGTKVNLERAMSAGTRFGGHYVSGHVDTTVKLLATETKGDFVQCRFGPFLPEHRYFLLPKGSIALNGVSLTINHVSADWLDLMLIPHTLAHTGFNLLDLEHRYNVEFDYLTRIVAHQLRIKAQEHEVL